MSDFIFSILSVIVVAVVVFLLGALIFFFLRWLFRFILFDFGYSDPKVSDGKVTDMDYTPPRTTFNGKTSTTTPEKNEVTFKTEQGETTIDSETLYQRVRIKDKIKVHFQQRYLRPKFWAGDWTYDGLRLLKIEIPSIEETVTFNDVGPIYPETRNKK